MVSGVASGTTSGEASGVASGTTSGTTSGEASGTTSGEASGAASGVASGVASGSSSGPASRSAPAVAGPERPGMPASTLGGSSWAVGWASSVGGPSAGASRLWSKSTATAPRSKMLNPTNSAVKERRPGLTTVTVVGAPAWGVAGGKPTAPWACGASWAMGAGRGTDGDAEGGAAGGGTARDGAGWVATRATGGSEGAAAVAVWPAEAGAAVAVWAPMPAAACPPAGVPGPAPSRDRRSASSKDSGASPAPGGAAWVTASTHWATSRAPGVAPTRLR